MKQGILLQGHTDYHHRYLLTGNGESGCSLIEHILIYCSGPPLGHGWQWLVVVGPLVAMASLELASPKADLRCFLVIATHQSVKTIVEV